MTGLLLALALTSTAAAPQASPDPSSSQTTSRSPEPKVVLRIDLSPIDTSPTDPYRRLFQVPRAAQPGDAPSERTELNRTVICGMLVIEVDSSGDPRMPVLTPSGDVRYTMRVQEPSMCARADAR